MTDILFALIVFIASFGIGYRLVVRVPQMLHTPLMSMTNAISAVVILGAIALLAVSRDWPQPGLATIALFAASFNIVGGFFITGRMLKMFKSDTSREAHHD